MPQGIQGPQGASVQGPIGKTGNDGLTPTIGDNGNWFIGSTDTGVHAQGPKGDMPDVSDFVTSATLSQNVTVINAAISKRALQSDFANLQAQVKDNTDNVAENTGNIVNMTATVSDHEKTIKQLQQRADDQDKVIKALQDSIAKLTPSSNDSSSATSGSSSDSNSASAEPATSGATSGTASAANKPANSGAAEPVNSDQNKPTSSSADNSATPVIH